MDGLLWTVALWTALLLILRAAGYTPRPFERETMAAVILLLGTASTVSRSADEVLSTPLVGETLVRGALATVALVMVAPLVLSRVRTAPARAFKGMTAITAYALIAALSTAYSVAMVSTAGKAYELAVAVIIAWAVALRSQAESSARRIVELLVLYAAFQVAIAVVGFFAVPSLFAEVQSRTPFIGSATMVSPYSHSNGLSAAGAMVSAYALARWFESSRRKPGDSLLTPIPTRVWAVMFVLGTVGTVLASARQGLVIWLVSVAAVLWVFRRQLLLLTVPIAGWLVAANWDAIWEIVSRNQQASTLATWSGRLLYWQSGFEALSEHPFTGFGFGAGGRFVALRRIGSGHISSVHSGYVEALMGVGILGLIPLLFGIWVILRWAIRRIRSKSNVAIGALIVPLVLHTSVSLGFGAWLTDSVLMFLMLVVLADVDDARRTLPLARRALSPQLLRSESRSSHAS